MNRQTNGFPSLAAVIGMFALLFAFNSQANLIGSFNHSYDSGNVLIDLNVFDGQPGGKYLWEYTVSNIGFDPVPGATNGFSGFELFLPTDIPEITDITPNGSSTPPWEINCCSGHAVEWDIRDSVGNGVMIGETGIFSFLTDPRDVAINDSGWFHSWRRGGQTDIITTVGMHVPWVPGLSPISTPEPGVVALFAIGLIGLGFATRRRQRHPFTA